jgi:hypothetical protein
VLSVWLLWCSVFGVRGGSDLVGLVGCGLMVMMCWLCGVCCTVVVLGVVVLVCL